MDTGWKPGGGRRPRGGKGKQSMDDVLGDLLGDSGDEAPRPVSSGRPSTARGRSSRGSTRPSTRGSGLDDDFYSSLAAEADVTASDVSDADMNEMSKTLADLDDLEADLFKPKKATGKKTPPTREKTEPKESPRATEKIDREFSKSVEPPKPKARAEPARPKSTGSAKKIDFPEFDEDDPLAGLLSDDDDDMPKRKPTRKNTTQAPKPSPSEDLLEEAPKSADKKPAIERPPTRSGNRKQSMDDMDDSPLATPAITPRRRQAAKKKEEINFDDDDDDVLGGMGLEDEPPKKTPASAPRSRRETKKKDELVFDDDDVLGGMGLDDSPRAKPKAAAKKEEDPEVEGSKNFLSSLMGKSPANKHLERPASGDKREFVLDTKYKKSEPAVKKEKEPTEEDFTFGSYMPTAATSRPNSASRPSSRSVRFQEEDDPFGLFDDAPKRATSAPAGRRRGADVLKLDADEGNDWLELASGSPAPEPKKTKTPKAAEKKDVPVKKGEAADWLGLGDSPDPKDKSMYDELGLSESPPQVRKPPTGQSQRPATTEAADWLGVKEPEAGNKGDAVLDQIRAKSAEPRQKSDPSDWLGAMEKKREAEIDAVLEQRRSGSRQTSDPSNWLGVGGESKKPAESKAAESVHHGDPSDWLGRPTKPKQGADQSDWLGVKESSPRKQDGGSLANRDTTSDSADTDWLGRSKPSQQKGSDHLGLGDEVDLGAGSRGSPIRTRRVTFSTGDIFSTPSSRHTVSRLPWEKDDKSSITPTQETKPTSQQTPAGVQSAPTPQGLSQSGTSTPLQQPISTLQTQPLPVPNISDGLTNQLEEMRRMQEQQQQMLAEQRQKELQRQQEMIRQQQEMARQQQAEMARQQEEQVKQIQQRQQDYMEHMMQLQKQQLAPPTPLTMPPMTPGMGMPTTLPGMGMGMGLGAGMASMADPQLLALQQQLQDAQSSQQRATLDAAATNMELETKIRKLEIERDHLQSLLDSTKKRGEEEMATLEQIHKSHVKMLEETFQRRESRLREETEILTAQHMSRLKQLEQDKSEQSAVYYKKIEEIDKDRNHELERLKDIHRVAVAELKKDHEETVSRLKRVKEEEVQAVTSAHTHSRGLHSVLEQMEANARNLGNLQNKVESVHQASVDDRDVVSKAKQEQLRALQERLERQQHENEEEKTRLQQLIARMELQLREQTRLLEEDKWKLKQDSNRLETLQVSVEQEKHTMTEQLERERAEVKRSKESLLSEQKSIMLQLFEERRSLAEERAQMKVSERLLINKEQKESVRNVQAEAEYEGTMKAMQAEKERVSGQIQAMQQELHKMAAEKAKFEQQQREVDQQKEQLAQLALDLKHRSHDIEDMCLAAAQARDDGQAALMEARRIESQHESRLDAIQAQHQALRAKEKTIAEERLALAKERRSIKEVRGSSPLCINCSTPVKQTPSQSPGLPLENMWVLPPTGGATDPVSNIKAMSSAINTDHSLRTWRMTAERDKDFLADESMYLETLKYSPYHGSTSTVQ